MQKKTQTNVVALVHPNPINWCFFFQGDSGGPLYTINGDDSDGNQIGLVSFGPSFGCGVGAPDGFTDVFSFRDWIKENAGV